MPVPCQFPVLHQLILVQLSPGEHQSQLAPRQVPGNYDAPADVDLGRVFGVLGVKMRWIVIVPIQENPDPMEQGDDWHSYHQARR